MPHPDTPILLTTFPTFEDAHAAIALLNAAQIPASIEVDSDEGAVVTRTQVRVRRIAMYVSAEHVYDARMVIVRLREAGE